MSQTVNHDGVELHYEVFGDEASPVVLLISGAGAPAEFWPRYFCEKLAAQHFRVARFWHRDTGHSSHFDEPYPLSTLVSDVLVLLDALGADKAHLVGHSMGGYIAQLVATDHPDRVASCVPMASGPLFSEEGKTRLGLSSPDDSLWPKLMANLPKGDFQQDLSGWLATWQLLNGDLPIEEDLATAYTRALYEGPASNHQPAENHVYAMTTVPDQLADALSDCDVPMLYLTGTADPMVGPDHGAKAAELAAHGTFRALPGAGHMYYNRSTWDFILNEVASHCATSARA